MTDKTLVERLRHRGGEDDSRDYVLSYMGWEAKIPFYDLRNEAADEIERLTAELAEANTIISGWGLDGALTRLRAALAAEKGET